MKHEMICILCPRGCHLAIDQNGNVTGNFCKRGIPYAISEQTNPVRSLSSKVRVVGGEQQFVSVKTSKGVLKDRQGDVVEYLKSIRITAPVEMGQVVIKDVLGLGVDILATRNVKKSSL